MIRGRARLVWLLPLATLTAAIVLAFRSCDSSAAFGAAAGFCGATGVIAGGLLFIHRGRPAETVGGLLAAALGALALAAPIAVFSFVGVVILAAIHCGL